MFSRVLGAVALAGMLAGAGAGSAQASLSYVGGCAGASASACVITDGSFDYLSVGGAHVTTAGLAVLTGQGWALGTRADFAGMVARNAPLMSASWNDAFLPDGPDADTLDDVVFGTEAVHSVFQGQFGSLVTARSGDPAIASAFKDIILKFGGQNADPAYLLPGLGTSEFDGSARHTVSMQAYLTDGGLSLSRNNVFSGAASSTTSNASLEASVARNYFLLRAAVAPVPEPGTPAMLLAGLGVLGAVARRRMSLRR